MSGLSSDSDDGESCSSSDIDEHRRTGSIKGCKTIVPIRLNVHLDEKWCSLISEEFDQLNASVDYSEKQYVDSAVLDKSKNRYRNIIPLRHSHIQLPDSYINANRIVDKYIATQGPMDRTVNDFWRMVYDNDVSIIVMLCKLMENGSSKCFQYWPTENCEMSYGQIDVWSETVSELSETVTVRKLIICDNTNEQSLERTVYQFQYLGWPDFGVPECTSDFSEFVELYRRLRPLDSAATQPYCVVHCSAGIGRTGSFIAIDMGIDSLMSAHNCDIREIVDRIRFDRLGMIQTVDQYVFVYKVLLQYYVLYGNNVDNDSLMFKIRTDLMAHDFMVR